MNLENLVLAIGLAMVFIGLGSLVNRDANRRAALRTLLYGLFGILLFVGLRLFTLLINRWGLIEKNGPILLLISLFAFAVLAKAVRDAFRSLYRRRRGPTMNRLESRFPARKRTGDELP
jgi:hypothetical protein